MSSGGFGDAHNYAQMLGARGPMEVVQANSGEPGNFLVSEKFLTRFNCDHFSTIPSPDASTRVQSKITAVAQCDKLFEQECCRLKFQPFGGQANSQINPIKGFREKTYYFISLRSRAAEIPN